MAGSNSVWRQRKTLFLIREQADSSPSHQDENPKVALGHSDFLLRQTRPRAFCEGMLESLRANKVPVHPQRSTPCYVSKCLLMRKDVLTFQPKQVFYLFGRWIRCGLSLLFGVKIHILVFHSIALFVPLLNVEFTKNMCFI